MATWLPFARAAAVGWLPLAKKTMPKPPVDNSSRSDEILYVNVSGVRFQVGAASTERAPNYGSKVEEFQMFHLPFKPSILWQSVHIG